MRLAAIYIYKGILPHIFGFHHEGFTINLGGKYNYILEDSQRGVSIKQKTENTKFIENFWLNNIKLISAIVGENGTGKTSLLNLFRNNDVCCVYESLENDEPTISQDTNEIEVIYYSGFFNINMTGSEADGFRDLSKYRLMLDDVSGYESLDLSTLLELHNSENLKRWVKFIELRNIGELLKEISLPIFNKIKIKINSFQIQEHQTSYNFRPFFEYFKKRIQTERAEREEALFKKLNLTKREDIMKSKAGHKIRLELEIIDCVIEKTQNILERSGNKYLQEGHLLNDYTVNSEEFTNQTNTKKAFYWFLENSYIQFSKESPKIQFPIEKIKKLIEVMISKLPDDDEIENWTEFDADLPLALKILNVYEEFLLAFKNDFAFDRKILLTFKPSVNLSSGEKGLYNLFSALQDLQYRIENNIHTEYSNFNKREIASNEILLLLDEADLGFHPEWKKKYVNIIQQVIPFIFKGKNIQILITTHDPLTLSDIPNNNIVYLQKDGELTKMLEIGDSKRPDKTFGANISDLLADSFFVKEGLIGDFAKSKIAETIEWINTNKDSNKNKIFKKEINHYKKVISIIDEHITKIKLAEMISELEPDNEFQKSIIDEQIASLLQRKKDLE